MATDDALPPPLTAGAPTAPVAGGAVAHGTAGLLSSGVEWVWGFHGAVHTTDVPDSWSLLELALSRRALGVESLATLTDLPLAVDRRAEPSNGFGAVRVGTSARGDPPVVDLRGRERDHAPPANAAAVPAARWDGVESLATYIDRSLTRARFLPLPNRGRAYATTKRALDVAGALLGLVVALPVLIVLTVWIRLDSPGPAIFRQTRVTRGGKTFVFYKFRTMYVDARERFPELYRFDTDTDGLGDTYYKLADDPRNTRVGRWLRRTTLDELPNLFNVLKGDLSLVGPRPELPELVQFYRPEELACFFTKAGLTGLAQVAGRSLLTVRERLTLDLRYVGHQTLLLDLRILWRTVIVVLLGRGAF